MTDSVSSPERNFFDAMLTGFQYAASKSEFSEKRFRIGGRLVAMQFAGHGTPRNLVPALEHLEVKDCEAAAPESLNAELTIHCWDSASTGVPLPPLIEALQQLIRQNCYEHLSPRQEIKQISNAGFPATYEAGTGIFSVLDAKQRSAVYWLNDADDLKYYERGAPVRTILNWWLEPLNMQCIHAGAVGTPDGGILLTGKGGSGKSTTALACVESDLMYASDDYCLVSSEPKPHVFSLYNTAKMCGLADLQRQPQYLPLIDNPNCGPDEKLLLFLHQHRPEKVITDFPLKAIFIPQVTGRPDTQLTPVRGAEAVRAIVPTTLFQLPGSQQAAFHRMTKLVRSLPAFRLELGTNIAEIPTVISDFLKNTPLPQ